MWRVKRTVAYIVSLHIKIGYSIKCELQLMHVPWGGLGCHYTCALSVFYKLLQTAFYTVNSQQTATVVFSFVSPSVF